MRTEYPPISRNFIESVLVLLLLLALLMAMVNTLKIFFGVFTFAIIFYVSFSAPYEGLVKLVKRRKLASWGFTGMFKGAIIMAVFYTVFNSWLERKQSRGKIQGEKTVSPG